MTRDRSMERYWFIYKEMVEDSLEMREASKDTIENINTNALKDNNKAFNNGCTWSGSLSLNGGVAAYHFRYCPGMKVAQQLV